MKLTQLQYFMCISECGSFTKAAEQLHITQPSLSKAIAELEVEAGTTLLLRTKSGVQLTQEGQIVLEQVRNILRETDELSEMFRQMRQAYHTLKIGIPPTMGYCFIPEIMGRVSTLKNEVPIEWKESGTRIAATMREYCHRFDPTRLMTVASSSGPAILIPADVAGYNYILQNPVEQHRKDYPGRRALGSEETTGCGTRGIYFDAHGKGHMVAHNRKPNGPDSLLNCIERGWKFYDERPYLAGLFYWTGFDYRGEPNPMKFPATGSQFGILDYCGFPKDEAWYLKSWWTDEPVLHILPHWNLQGHEGDSIDIWVYSNCDEVELTVNGKKLDRKPMPRNGHLSWKAVFQPGAVKAVGYKNGKKILARTVETTGAPARISLTADRSVIQADNRDVAVCNIELQDKKKRFVPTACNDLTITVSGPVRILGVGNGDPAYQATERPADADARTYQVKAFNGLAQVLLQSTGEVGEATMTVVSENLPETSCVLKLQK